MFKARGPSTMTVRRIIATSSPLVYYSFCGIAASRPVDRRS
jgi:hypothetical protein